METKPLVVIVGPTASGKTNLAIDLAKKFNGEIICADSRTVYKGMNIGTAKPTSEDMDRVPHWGLDLIEPGQYFSAADFKKYAVQKIDEIRSRGNTPFLVGGTGLYVDAVVLDYSFGAVADPSLRNVLECMTIDELHKYCHKNNINLPENSKNKRYVIRAIEQNGVNIQRRNKPVDNIIVVGIATDKPILRTRIELRAEQLLTDGVVEEAKLLGNKYGWESEAMTGNIYPLCKMYLDGDITFSELKAKFIVLDWRLAKRQMTWLKRNTFVEWLSLEDARKKLTSVLASEQ